MASQEHLDILNKGVQVWNEWRKEHPDIQPDFRGTNLSGAILNFADFRKANLTGINLSGANLSGADLSEANFLGAILRRAVLSGANLHLANLYKTDLSERANLSGALLWGADLSEANLMKADLSRANLWEADLSRADLSGADLSDATISKAKLIKANLSGADLSRTSLSGADLSGADLTRTKFEQAILKRVDMAEAFRTPLRGTYLSGADLSGADLSWANLSGADLSGANLTGCRVYAISAWDVQLKQTSQSGLIITPVGEATITVDNLEVAQFIYLLLNNGKIREVIDTITSKVVLILGRFIPERKAVLDALKDELRKRDYLPVLFDFEKPSSRDFTETVRTLAHLSRFIIADLTDPSSIPQELQAIVPDLEVPVLPLLLEVKREYSMFPDFRKYHWVLPIYLYKDRASLIGSLHDAIIEPAEKKAKELAIEKAKRLERP